ncbi:MAG: hypothetical protein U0Q07_08920 [Acidimicrobiales bacterium]
MDGLTAYAFVELFFFVVKVWALVTWLRLPSWAWTAAERSRATWLLLLVLSLLLPVIGLVLALWFLFSTSVAVKRMARLGRGPGFPGGP